MHVARGQLELVLELTRQGSDRAVSVATLEHDARTVRDRLDPVWLVERREWISRVINAVPDDRWPELQLRSGARSGGAPAPGPASR